MKPKSHPFLRRSLALTASSAFLTTGPLLAATYNWEGDTSADFTGAANWVENAWTQWDDYRFGTAVTSGAVTINGYFGINSLTLESGLTQDIVITSTGSQPVIMGVGVTGNSSALIAIDAASRDLTINGEYIAASAVTWDIGAGRTLTLNGPLNNWFNPAALVKNGAGAALLTSSNGYSGSTTINGGTLVLQGSGGGGTNYNGGAIAINGTSTLRVTGERYNFAGETFTFDSVGGGTIDAIASGAGGFVFTGNNTFATTGGARNIISGTRIASENQGLNLNGTSVVFDVATGSDPTSDLEVIGTIWNGGSVTKNGAGRLEFSAPQQYAGDTTVNEGTLILGDGVNNVGLSNSHDVVIESGATLQLNYAVGNSDSIDELSLGGVLQSPGVYGAGTYSGVTITGTGTLTVLNGPPADPFANWMATNYPTIVAPDNAPGADPDNDGIENLIEYVLQGGDPSVSTTGILPTLDASGANFVFTYLRRAAATGTTQTFQYGTDLTGWTDLAIPGGAGVVVTDLGGGIDEVEITVAKGINPKLFGRLLVTQP